MWSFTVTIYGSSVRGVGEDKMCIEVRDLWLKIIIVF